MAQKKGSQLITRIASDTNDSDVPGISHFTCNSSFLKRFPGFAAGGNDKNGVVASNGARDFGKFCAIDGRREGLSAAGWSLEDEKVFSGTNVQKEFTKGAGKGRNSGGFLRQAGARLVPLVCLDEA